MEGAPLEIAKRYLEGVFAEDYETTYSLLDSDVEFVTPKISLRGSDAVRAVWSKAEYDNLRPVVEREFSEAKEGVHVTTLMTWHWKESGEVAYRTRIESDFTLRDGKITHMKSDFEHSGP